MSREAQARQPAVGHFVHTWLGLTETFIFQYVSRIRRFRPVVVCTGTSNLEQFPASPLALCPRPRRGTVSWAACGVAARVFARRWPAADAFVRGRIAAAARRHGLALMHAHFADGALFVLPVCRRLHLPLITSFYGYDACQSDLLDTHRADYARLFREGDRFLVEGPRMMQRVAGLGCPRDKLRIQHIAIDLSRIPFRPRRAPTGATPIRVLFVGRFVEKKGILDAIAAFGATNGGRRSMQLRLIGDGPLRPQVEALIKELGLTSRASLLGYVPYERMVQELARAHILLAPSTTAPNGDAEGGAPTVLLEAQASGLPIVSTKHADIPYVLAPAAAARLCDEGDLAGLAAALEDTAGQPESWG
ncbi:MAG: glycosyltransferase, partial [Armatimonadota bacterium]